MEVYWWETLIQGFSEYTTIYRLDRCVKLQDYLVLFSQKIFSSTTGITIVKGPSKSLHVAMSVCRENLPPSNGQIVHSSLSFY